jgi:hypothetical protein
MVARSFALDEGSPAPDGCGVRLSAECRPEGTGLTATRRVSAIRLGAIYLFEEPGSLEGVARLAEPWFLRHRGSDSRTRRHPSRTDTSGPIPTTCDPR